MLKFILKLSSVISIFLLLTGCNKGGNAPVNTNDKTHMLVDVMQHQLPWKFGEMGSCEQISFEGNNLVMEINLASAIEPGAEDQIKTMFEPLLFSGPTQKACEFVIEDGYGYIFRLKGFNRQVDVKFGNEELKRILEKQQLSEGNAQEIILENYVKRLNAQFPIEITEGFIISGLELKEGVRIIHDLADTHEEPLEIDLSEVSQKQFFEDYFLNLGETDDRAFIGLCSFTIKADKPLTMVYNGTGSGRHYELKCSAEELRMLYMRYLNEDYPLSKPKR